MSRYLRRHEASAYLTKTIGVPCARTTLNKLAVVGGGPAFVKFGGRIPLYSIEDLDAWAAERLTKRKFTSTSEYSAS
ncbi:helix-turn-helix transcriptional regulator [Mesorhizobium marinum]|uniref:Helix-turn-helix transcriptional regulator n=1 Tax=Mesorhizobium marinum TaxID=3228790 RepID=A0ABV3QZP3_9HYPH